MRVSLSQLSYQRLGLRPGATRDEINRAFKARVQAEHPDRHGNSAESNGALRELIEARKAALAAEEMGSFREVDMAAVRAGARALGQDLRRRREIAAILTKAAEYIGRRIMS